ncbi:NAD(P)-binding protein [Polychaeton citri CBS 116435]|uniref:NAD(P)-binding protein n=1 Tax=Polychaeton citri CBS 116435 TaxID=1314669 RepID=A0A9P4UJL9_9PEZI|nr:NAD(P)-binding protein [Polychaeton citri CBS 116435]
MHSTFTKTTCTNRFLSQIQSTTKITSPYLSQTRTNMTSVSSLPTSMRAAQWTSNTGGLERNLRVNSEAKLPKDANALPKDSILVRVAYSSLNPVDYKLPELPLLGNFLFSKPATPGLDFSGKVVSSQVPHLKPGEPVFGKVELPNFGALSEYVVVGKQGVAKIPNGVSAKDAACVGVTGLTAFQCIVPFVKPGDKILINGGSGGTGTFGIQLAKAAGCHVTATCSGANVELCKSLGADEVIDYRTQSVVDTLKRSGTRFDHIVDNVFADPNLYWQSEHYLKPDGQYVTIAGEAKLTTISAFLKIFLIPTFLGGGKRKFQMITCASNTEQYNQIAKWMGEGKVKVVIEQELDLSEVGKGYERLKSGRTRGKVVIKVSDS